MGFLDLGDFAWLVMGFCVLAFWTSRVVEIYGGVSPR